MDNTTVTAPESNGKQTLEELYQQYFTPPINDTVAAFKQVSLYDDSLATYTSDSTTGSDSCA